MAEQAPSELADGAERKVQTPVAATFCEDEVKTILAGASTHHYAYAKISKENLAEALYKTTSAISMLVRQGAKQAEQIKALQERAGLLEGANVALESKVCKQEEMIDDAHAQLAAQKTAFEEERDRADTRAQAMQKAIDEQVAEVEELDLSVQRLLRQSDRQQGTIQMLKLDLAKAQELAGKAIEMIFEMDEDDGEFEDLESLAPLASSASLSVVETGGDGKADSTAGDGDEGIAASVAGDVSALEARMQQRRQRNRMRKAQASSRSLPAGSNRGGGGDGGMARGHGRGGGGGGGGKGGKGGAMVNTDDLKISSEQVFCQDIDLASGELKENLVPLSKLLAQIGNAHAQVAALSMSDAGEMDKLRKAVENRASTGDVDELRGSLDTTCVNLANLLRGFYEAGILEQAPPAVRLCDEVAETPPPAPGSVDPPAAQPAKSGGSDSAGDKIVAIRSSAKSRAIGPFQVSQGLRDMSERFEGEVDALSEELSRTVKRLGIMQTELDTKLDAGGVESKIEVKFDEVIDQLDKAIATAGADEEEFKRAAKELQETCALLSSSKADAADVMDIRKKMELDSHIADQVEQIQRYMEDKLNRSEADEMISGKVAKEELGAKLQMLHRRLKAELELAMDEKNGIKPWILTKSLHNGCTTEGSHSTPLEALTCIACNRQVTPGQMELLRRSPAVHNAAMNRNRLESSPHSPHSRRSRHGSPRSPGQAQVSPFENDDLPETSISPRSAFGGPNNRSPRLDLHKRPKALRPLGAKAKRPAKDKESKSDAEEERVPPPPVDKPALWAEDVPIPDPEAMQGPRLVSSSSERHVVADGAGSPVIEQVPVKTFAFD